MWLRVMLLLPRSTASPKTTAPLAATLETIYSPGSCYESRCKYQNEHWTASGVNLEAKVLLSVQPQVFGGRLGSEVPDALGDRAEAASESGSTQVLRRHVLQPLLPRTSPGALPAQLRRLPATLLHLASGLETASDSQHQTAPRSSDPTCSVVGGDEVWGGAGRLREMGSSISSRSSSSS